MDLGDIFKSMEGRKFDEAYLAVIYDVKNNKAFRILVPSRQDLSEMLGLLKSDQYALTDMMILGLYKDFTEFMKELVDNNKPKGLTFGDES